MENTASSTMSCPKDDLGPFQYPRSLARDDGFRRSTGKPVGSERHSLHEKEQSAAFWGADGAGKVSIRRRDFGWQFHVVPGTWSASPLRSP